MKTMPYRIWLASVVGSLACGTMWAAAQPLPTTSPPQGTPAVRAEIRSDRAIFQAGQPLWITFTLTNMTPDPIVLKVPEVPAAEGPAETEVGLPLAHVFSGPRYTGVHIRDSLGDDWDLQVEHPPRRSAPTIRLGPHGVIGTRVELTQHYRSLKRPGKYTLVWRPYFASVESPPLHINLLAERQAVILTDQGSMTLRFYYDEAPNAVQNFVELVEQRFYDLLTFHKIVPFSLVLGGDPRGDGRGVRPDGKRLKAEFSSIPFDVGTVGMARLPRDPDSASCQFFICASRQPSFDGNETAFAYLVGEQSFETLKKIAAAPTNSRYRPERPVTIRSVSLESVPSVPDTHRPGSLDRPITTRPAIMDGGARSSQGLSRSNGTGPATRPYSEGG